MLSNLTALFIIIFHLHPNKIYRLLPGVFVFFLLHCSPDHKIVIKDFDTVSWKLDSMGCRGLRRDMGKVLQRNSNAVTGHSSEELKAFLGPPNVAHTRERTTIYTYFLEGGRHCYDKSWKEKGYTECLQILFFIENDKVRISDVIYP
jgi:hypothetical protein